MRDTAVLTVLRRRGRTWLGVRPVSSPDRFGSDAQERRPPDAPSREAGGRRLLDLERQRPSAIESRPGCRAIKRRRPAIWIEDGSPPRSTTAPKPLGRLLTALTVVAPFVHQGALSVWRALNRSTVKDVVAGSRAGSPDAVDHRLPSRSRVVVMRW